MSDEVETLDMDGLVAATATIPDTPLEYTHDGWCILSKDPVTGIEIHAKEDGDKMHVREVMDAEALVEENRAIRSELTGTKHPDGMSLAARVPLNVFWNRLGEALKQGDSAYLKRWLNNPDHSAFKVRDGRI